MARPKKQSLEVPEDPPAEHGRVSSVPLEAGQPPALPTRNCSATQRPALPHVEWTYTLE